MTQILIFSIFQEIVQCFSENSSDLCISVSLGIFVFGKKTDQKCLKTKQYKVFLGL